MARCCADRYQRRSLISRNGSDDDEPARLILHRFALGILTLELQRVRIEGLRFFDCSRLARRAGIPITIAKDAGSPVNAASILGVIALGVEQGDYVTLTADGAGAESTLDTLAELLTTDHDAEA